MKQPFLPSSATEKRAQLAPEDAMADAAGAESRPRTRGKEFRLPLAALNNMERGLRAAIQVLQDGLSPKSARTKWLVDADCLRYYPSCWRQCYRLHRPPSAYTVTTSGDCNQSVSTPRRAAT